MLVDCNKPYVLKVNDVEWSPIGIREGKDEYVISSSGFFEILVDDVRVFFFRNSITPDFEHGAIYLSFREGDTTIYQESSSDYVQTGWSKPSQPFDSLIIRIQSVDSASASTLELSCNNGTAEIYQVQENLMRISVEDFDTNEYLMLKLGNVLLAFITTD